MNESKLLLSITGNETTEELEALAEDFLETTAGFGAEEAINSIYSYLDEINTGSNEAIEIKNQIRTLLDKLSKICENEPEEDY